MWGRWPCPPSCASLTQKLSGENQLSPVRSQEQSYVSPMLCGGSLRSEAQFCLSARQSSQGSEKVVASPR